MKHAFSRLITFINHLLANVLSTFVERWLNTYVGQFHQCSGENLVVNPRGSYVMDVVQIEGAVNYIVLISEKEEIRHDSESNCQ